MSEEVADFACTNTDITCGNVNFGTNITIEFGHERLAETHDFGLALATRREVGATLAATHGECGERVLERLFETEELEDREVNRCVEAETSLVWTDG